MSEVFQLLDSVKTQVGILDWGIKMTTLEDGETTLFYSILDGLPARGWFLCSCWDLVHIHVCL